MSEFDSPWKEALDGYLRLFLEFFFADIADDIDWSRGYEALDKELEQIVREAELGTRLADKLFKVWRKGGDEVWVLIHIEVQAQPETEFPERMYVYNYRIFDRFRRAVASLAVLGDERHDWRPDAFGYDIWGCTARLRFRTVKLLDYAADTAALETHVNPFGLIVLAHLQSQATRGDGPSRRDWKVRLIKELLLRGMDPEQIRQFFRFIDWLLDLPAELELQFYEEIQEFSKEQQMPYISTMERQAIEKGHEEGRQVLVEIIETELQSKFGEEGTNLAPAVREIKNLDSLRLLWQAIRNASSVQDVKNALGNGESADE